MTATLSRRFAPLRPLLMLHFAVLISACAAPNSMHADEQTTPRTGTVAPPVERAGFRVGGEEFEAAIERPAPARGNGWGVLLIGGGLGNDLDWTTPGVLELNGNAVQFTLSGDPHADAPVLSGALAERGFTVLRWSTIARGDPLAAEWPSRATPRTLSQLLEQSRAALATLRGVGGVRAEQVVLVGHSLGAARAFTLAEDDAGVRAVVALAPAYFSARGELPASFVKSGMRAGQDVAARRNLPVLALFGALDGSPVVDAAGVQALAGTDEFPRLESVLFNGLGHQLGPEAGGRYGPIDPGVVDLISGWLEHLVGPASPSGAVVP